MNLHSRAEAKAFYSSLLDFAEKKGKRDLRSALRELCKRDLFFLLVYICKRKDLDRDWLFDRCREVQMNPDGYLDLWAREHYKSTIITFGKTIQDILNDPEITVGLFSYNFTLASAFLTQIKRELESNGSLISLFPDILWHNTRKAPKWTETDGIIVKRDTNPKEATIEAWGLDSQPVSKHYKLLVYDDVVVPASVTPGMILKTRENWETSLALGAEGGRVRYIGTRYNFNDLYATQIDRGIPARIYPATDSGTADGEPVLLSAESLKDKRAKMGPYVFSCQMLLNPKPDSTDGFYEEWLKYWKADKLYGLNITIVVDPANEKHKKSDYTAMFVLGRGADDNWYVIDIVRDRLNLTERANTLIALHKKYRPYRGFVFYEKYGKDSDISHIETVMAQINYRFTIYPVGGNMGKTDRIRRLVPYFETGRIYLPETCFKKDHLGMPHDLIKEFKNEEYLPFPVGGKDDMLDALARLPDFEGRIPKPDIDEREAAKPIVVVKKEW